MNRNVVIIALILPAIATVMITSFLSYRNAKHAADDFLKAEALGIAAALDTTLARYGTGENIFRDIIRAEQWEGIAYLALYGEDGTIVLHSNRNLIGRKADDADIAQALKSGKTAYFYRTLGTGEDVFVMDTALHFGAAEKILRVVLHTYPSRKIIRGARLQLWSATGIGAVLSLLALVLLFSMKKRETLAVALAEKEKLSILGEMAAGMAHEIRNPLGSIKGFSQYLKERCVAQDALSEESEYLDVIIAESSRIERLTEDLLSYARKDTVHPETCRPFEVIAELMASLGRHPSISVKNLVDKKLVIKADREKLRQIIGNLLRNSFEAMPGGGEVTVRGRDEDRTVLFSVEDPGEGIDDETKQKIFRPFFTTKARGTGLGLSIVERYVRLLGGKIHFESSAGKGSVFTVVIPKR